MSIGEIVTLIRGAVFHILLLCTPVLGAALIIGLVVAIFQATTSIQEQTLTFLPKMIVILIVLAVFGGWMVGDLRNYALALFDMIPNLAR